jgi:hypothetical protein
LQVIICPLFKIFHALIKLLTQLTWKDSKFCWSEPQQTSFDALKEALTSDAFLAHLEFDNHLYLVAMRSTKLFLQFLARKTVEEKPL